MAEWVTVFSNRDWDRALEAAGNYITKYPVMITQISYASIGMKDWQVRVLW